MVNTTGCGPVDLGSIPSSHPILRLPRSGTSEPLCFTPGFNLLVIRRVPQSAFEV